MFWNGVYKAGRVAGPVLIHYLAAYIVVIVGRVGLHINDAALLTTAAALVVLPLFVQCCREDASAQGREFPGRLSWRAGVCIFVLGVLCNWVLTELLNLFLQLLPVQLPNTAQEALFAGSFPIQLIGIGVAVPLMEEVLFRGLVYQRLRGYTKTVWPAAALSAAVFALYHGNLIQMLFAFPMGLLLAELYRRWDTIKAPVLFHIAVNVSSICFTAFF